ncbi:MAG: hypothetical protein GY756_20195 [bacterium]|nr:hypothetical protein [bacterium]
MKFFIKSYRLIIYLGFCASILICSLLITGCSKQKKIPAPPHIQAQLINELFSALRSNNYELALKKIDRLSAQDPDAPYYGAIQNTTENNMAIYQVQEILDKGNIEQSIDSVNKLMNKKGQTTALIDTVSELNTLLKIKKLTEKISQEEDARALAVSTGKLNREIASYSSAGDLKPFAERQLTRSKNIRGTEKQIGIEDLKADIDVAWVEGHKNLDTLIAILEVSSPNSPLAKAYKESMQVNWKSTNANQIYFTPAKEFIYFREALADNSIRNELFKKIIKFQPNNFKSLLIKSIILNYQGNKKAAAALTKNLKTQLTISDELSKKWFIFKPNRKSNLNELNPFVSYPFFIYTNDFLIK